MPKRGRAHKTHIRIETLDREVEDFPEDPAEWVDHLPDDGVTLATVTPRGGREFISGAKLSEEVSHVVELRWQPGIVAGMRVVIDDQELEPSEQRKLHIASVLDENDRNRDLVLSCTETR